jgi:hypothetical protein
MDCKRPVIIIVKTTITEAVSISSRKDAGRFVLSDDVEILIHIVNRFETIPTGG